jgi:hypothetical protein
MHRISASMPQVRDSCRTRLAAISLLAGDDPSGERLPEGRVVARLTISAVTGPAGEPFLFVAALLEASSGGFRSLGPPIREYT